jgi:hypothetical protein
MVLHFSFRAMIHFELVLYKIWTQRLRIFFPSNIWVSNSSTVVYWKHYPFFIELPLHLCQLCQLARLCTFILDSLSIPLYMSVFSSIPHYFDYWDFAILSKLGTVILPTWFFFENYLVILIYLLFHPNFKISLSKMTNIWNIYWTLKTYQ